MSLTSWSSCSRLVGGEDEDEGEEEVKVKVKTRATWSTRNTKRKL